MLEIDEIMEHEKYIFRVARKYLKNKMDADDVSQDALLKAITRRHQFDPTKAALTTWLYQIVFNEAMQFFNKSKRTITNVDDLVSREDDHFSSQYDLLFSEDEAYELDGVMSDSELTNEAYKKVVELAHTYPTLVKYDLVDVFIEYYSIGKGLKGYHNHQYSDKYMKFDDICAEKGLNGNTARGIFRRAKRYIAKKMMETVDEIGPYAPYKRNRKK